MRLMRFRNQQKVTSFGKRFSRLLHFDVFAARSASKFILSEQNKEHKDHVLWKTIHVCQNVCKTIPNKKVFFFAQKHCFLKDSLDPFMNITVASKLLSDVNFATLSKESEDREDIWTCGRSMTLCREKTIFTKPHRYKTSRWKCDRSHSNFEFSLSTACYSYTFVIEVHGHMAVCLCQQKIMDLWSRLLAVYIYAPPFYQYLSSSDAYSNQTTSLPDKTNPIRLSKS